MKGLQRRVLGVGAQGSEGSTEKGIRSGGTRMGDHEEGTRCKGSTYRKRFVFLFSPMS